jgi:hypothetical protein
VPYRIFSQRRRAKVSSCPVLRGSQTFCAMLTLFVTEAVHASASQPSVTERIALSRQERHDTAMEELEVELVNIRNEARKNCF